MTTKRRLKAEIVRLTYRVAELEERLCPCEGHDWKRIDSEFIPDCYGFGEMRCTQKCRTCGKERVVYEF